MRARGGEDPRGTAPLWDKYHQLMVQLRTDVVREVANIASRSREPALARLSK